MSRFLAAVYSHVFGLSVDLTVLAFCDPASVDPNNLCAINDTLIQTSSCLCSLLDEENFTRGASSLSLELSHLLFNLERFSSGLRARVLGDAANLETGHEPGCEFHATVPLSFYGGVSTELKLCFMNDVETVLKKLNGIFYCLSAANALNSLRQVALFLRRLRGISPVPRPDLFILELPCFRCRLEEALFPNQGESVEHNLFNRPCDHLCVPVPPEPIRGLFQNELIQAGLLPESGPQTTFRPRSASSAGGHSGSELEATLRVLDRHTIFDPTTPGVSDLSTLLYWSTGLKSASGPEALESSFLGELFDHGERMWSSFRRLEREGGVPLGPSVRADSSLTGVERLFSGCIFASQADVVDAVKKDCSSTFFNRADFQSVWRKQNELYARLNALLHSASESEDPAGVPAADEAIESAPRVDRTVSDAEARKQLYLKRVTQQGFQRLLACLEANEEIISGALSVRVWGSLVYEMLSEVLNHYIWRQTFLGRSWLDARAGTSLLFEASKSMKSCLFQHRLAWEHLDSLTMTFYRLLTGPLLTDSDLFPVPPNVALSYCFDSAGILPHQKLKVTEMIWPGMEPRDWIDLNFNQFFKIRCRDLNSVQREVWTYVRELVLSVALYNVVWEKDLVIYGPRTGSAEALKCLDGIYLTYEEAAPLILVVSGEGRVFGDIYALLDTHLHAVA